MFRVEMYYQVRRACLVEGMSVREASRVFGLHRDTVRRMLANAKPQGYTRQRRTGQPPVSALGCLRLAADRPDGPPSGTVLRAC